jgi:hypothetical protein
MKRLSEDWSFEELAQKEWKRELGKWFLAQSAQVVPAPMAASLVRSRVK